MRPGLAFPETPATRMALGIVQRLHEAGFIAYFAGGCVRDMLLARPIVDYDIATNATPGDIGALFPHTFPKGEAFGVTSVMIESTEFEVAAFRSEGDYTDGRRPGRVAPASPEEDAQRRDFTVNGMFYDPIRSELIDTVGGRASLEAREIRCIGDPNARFEEDKLRLLRAVRLAAQLEFDIEERTWQALMDAAPRLSVVSVERIAQELRRMLLDASRLRGFELLRDSGLLSVALPEMLESWGTLECALKRLRWVLAPTSEPMLWAALFLNAPEREETAQRALRRLKLPLATGHQITEILRVFHELPTLGASNLAQRKRLVGAPTFAEALELLRLDDQAGLAGVGRYDSIRELSKSLDPATLNPAPLLDGGDLIALGVTPGPRLGNLLARVREAQLNEQCHSREEALALARRWAGQPPQE